ncbi:coiled-coil-helix-coiled-coil-helix domain-containing protein 2 isoform X2 [Phlebotomus argentipes]|uniref:coiled-coil-helix-coiled-coil-helix domain-containing protein 2 isoform X2 n=1 Tax=Phlebotomus argentipes TaxID=94469 RepID=UPI002892D964|nr:coiled-coil-helix-coiled-coil-helix domain-containing protein 2 isoform X2 [Phlebotomus argentipes]
MPRRGRSASPPPAPQRRAASPPPVPVAPPPTAMAPVGAAPQQPSMFKQMAATAGGVAVGSAIGHTMGHALTGMFSGGDKEVAQQQPQQPMSNGQPGQYSSPCSFEIEQFLQCAQGQSDLGVCEGFNEALRQCKTRYNIAQ